MKSQSFSNPPCNCLIVAGLVLAALSAFVPFYTAGYRLMVGVLLAGMLPYLVYAIAIPLMRGMLTIVSGIVLVLVHAWLVVNERFIGGADYSDGLIYYVPILMAIAVVPLAVAALLKPWDNRVEHEPKVGAPENQVGS